jgi:hypothetical protein
MKNFLLLLAVLGLLLAPAAAQSNGVSADIPFQFLVNGTVLPAGHYEITISNLQNRALLTNTDTGQKILTDFRDISLNGKHPSTKLVFALNGEHYVLHQISITGDNHTHDLIHGSEVAELIVR